jgi:DNA-binding NtrC family response regulator
MQENRMLRQQLLERFRVEGIVGSHSRMLAVFDTLHKVSGSHATVLIQGESGTGKELIARAIHRHSPRKDGPFVGVSCAALTESLLESELFGYEKGAFTGAVSRRLGLFEAADQGTLFLDEIGDGSPKLQLDLLRVLDAREFRRVGGSHLLKTDVRILAATNRDLKQLVESGAFREDLFYRLNVVSLAIPPLRERKEDIPLLIEHFLKQFGTGYTRKTLSPEALQLLTDYAWPGNVRELGNLVERLVILTPGDLIGPEDLPPAFRASQGAPPLPPRGPVSLAEMERAHVARILAETGGRKLQAARLLGIDIKTLNKKIKDYRIELPRPPAS